MMIGPFQGRWRFLSNFWSVRVGYDNEVYPSVEHAYQAAKTLSYVKRGEIRRCSTAGEAKRCGRQLVKLGLVRDDWSQISLQVMKSLLERKFGNKELADKLLATGEQELVEMNTWGDTFWGICNGDGHNWLGKMLMEIRNDLKGHRYDL